MKNPSAAARIVHDDIARIAQAGVTRALAARATLSELSADQLAAVSGGASLALASTFVFTRPGLLAGPYPVEGLVSPAALRS
jgi:hypothetical protein